MSEMNTPLRASSVPATKRKHLDVVSPDKDEHLSQLLSGADSEIPAYAKVMLSALLETRRQMETLQQWCLKVSEENAQLKIENARLKQLVECKNSSVQAAENSLSPSPNPPSHMVASNDMIQNSLHEFERRRSVVIYGIPELSSFSATDRALHDLSHVTSILSHLDVECLPCSVYRMGKPKVNGSRLVKVVLPSSKHRDFAVKRASRLRTFFCKGIFLRPSLSKEELERQRVARNSNRRLQDASGSVTTIDASQGPNPSVYSLNVSHAAPSGNS